MNLEQCYTLVEEAIEELGVSPDESRGEKAGQWNLQYGDYPIWIDVYSKEENIYFQVVSPIFKVENHPNRSKILETALKINDSLILTSISLYQEALWVRGILPSELITSPNVVLLLRYVGNAALQYGKYLNTNFQ